MRALVTGGTSGIGRALVRALVARGDRVLTCGRDPARVEALREEQPLLRVVSCDLAEAEDRRALAGEVEVHLGGLDLLVCCAGVQQPFDLVEGAEPEALRAELEVNLVAPVLLTQSLLPHLLASDRAAIVNVTSILALAPKPSAPLYGASKAGLASWTRALRAQLRPRGVHVMELVPPVVATRMTAGRDDGAIPPERVAEAALLGLERGLLEVRVGRARAAHALFRVAPGALARRLATS